MPSADSLIGSYTFPLTDLNWIMRNGGSWTVSLMGTLSTRFPSNLDRPESLKASLTGEKIMKITYSSKIHSLILAAALSIAPGFVSPVSAQVH